MKTYRTMVYPSEHRLYELFSKKINPLFADKIKKDIGLHVTSTINGIEIGQPDYYETYLYQIKVVGSEVHVSKSEHYVDDVNSLALEDIIDSIIVDYLGIDSIETILQP